MAQTRTPHRLRESSVRVNALGDPERIDSLFSGAMMPGMNGVDLGREVDADDPGCRWC